MCQNVRFSYAFARFNFVSNRHCLSEYPDILSVVMGLVLIRHGLLLGLSDCKAVGAIMSVVCLFDGFLLSVANRPSILVKVFGLVNSPNGRALNCSVFPWCTKHSSGFDTGFTVCGKMCLSGRLNSSIDPLYWDFVTHRSVSRIHEFAFTNSQLSKKNV